jgi:rRNA-processing protein FCF1
VLIDACGWVAVIDANMNFDSELLGILGKPQLVLLPKIVEELERLDLQRPRGKKLLLPMLLSKSSIEQPLDENTVHTDDQIVNLAVEKRLVVLTVDVQLKRRLFEAGRPVLEITKGKRLNLVDGL